MQRLLFCLFLFFAALMALAAYVVQTFGWPGLLGMLATGAVFGYVVSKLLPRMLFASLTAPMRAASEILEGATVRVHGFTTADAPVGFDPHEQIGYDPSGGDDEHDEYDDGPGYPQTLDWYHLDVTITPKSSLTEEPERLSHRKWQLDQIVLVNADPDSRPASPIPIGLGTVAAGLMPAGVIAEKEVWSGFEFANFDGEPVWGIQRCRFLVGIPKNVRRIAFVYNLFARFGDIPVPTQGR